MADTGTYSAWVPSPSRWVFLVLVLGALWCACANALSRDAAIRDLRHTAWGPSEGAPDGVNSLAQTSDGYLWMSSAAGLFRFDGLRFERIALPRDERLSSAKIYKLYAPASGGLWIGFAFGGAALLKDGQLTAYAERDGLPAGGVVAFAEDANHAIWAGTIGGLARLEGATWRKMGPDEGYSDTKTEELMVDSAGTLWAVSPNKVLFLSAGETTFHESAVQPVEPAARRPGVQGIAETASGAIWLFSDQAIRLLQKLDNPQRRIAAAGFGLAGDIDGGLWIATADGKLRRVAYPERLPTKNWISVDAFSDTYSDKDGLSFGSGFGALLVDREGNVWFGTLAGIDRFAERNVRSIVPALGAGDPFVPPLTAMAAGDAGALWIGGRNFALHSIREGHVERHGEVGYISCAIRADDGSLWFGHSTNVWKYAAGQFERTPLPDTPDRAEVQAMAEDRSGGLWVSIVGNGVYRLAEGGWTARGGIALLPTLTAVSMATDAAGRVWFGYTDGRVAILDGSSVRSFADSDRLSIGNVTAIYGKRSAVWVGGEFGLAVFDGDRFRAVLSQSSAPLTNVTGIVETADGELWLNTGSGIARMDAAEARRAAETPEHRVRVEFFDARDGVRGSSSRVRPLPTATQGTDGRLWFTTYIGLYAIDPTGIHRNPKPPPVLIQALVADDKAYAPAAGLVLPPRTTSLRIDYAGIDLTMGEKVRYRYRLDGVDKDWQDVEGRRQAFYTNLHPGTHRFRVVAANHDGVWNETGAALEFVIPPTFVQTGWFVALCVLAAAALLWVLIQLRFRQLAARMRIRFEERTEERERIARELHDTLLQATQALILKVQSALNRVAKHEPAHAILEAALEHADQVMAEGRDRIHDLRVPAEATSDLPKSIAAMGTQLVQGQVTGFATVVEGAVRELNPVVRDEAYRIGREALLNAFHHAHAKSIEVQIIYGDDAFRLRVRDDGTGIDVTTLAAGSRPGHWGLSGMRERAQRIGAAFDIWSRPDAGTEIELNVPAALAYARRARASRWAFMGRMTGGGA